MEPMEPGQSGPGLKSSQGSTARPKSRLMMMKDRLRQQRHQQTKKENESNFEHSAVNGHGAVAGRTQASSGLPFSKASRLSRFKASEESKGATQKKRSGLFKSRSVEMKLKGSSASQKSADQKSPISSSDEKECNVPNGHAQRYERSAPMKGQHLKKVSEVRSSSSSVESKRAPESRIAKAPILRIPSPSRARDSKLARPQTTGLLSATDRTPRTISPVNGGTAPLYAANKVQDSRRQQQPEDLKIFPGDAKLQQKQPRSVSPPSAKLTVDHNANIKTFPQEPQAKTSDCDQEHSSSPRIDESPVVQSKMLPSAVPSPTTIAPVSGHAAYSVGWVHRKEPVRSSSVEPDLRGRCLSREEWHQRRQSRSLDNLTRECEERGQIAECAQHVVSEEMYIISAEPPYLRPASAESLSSIGSGNGYPQQRPPEGTVPGMKRPQTEQDMYGQEMWRMRLQQIPEMDAPLRAYRGK